MELNNYQTTSTDVWTGRTSNPLLENQYWYQQIVLKHINEITSNDNIDMAIVGYECDEGVRRNLGRIGAKNGPRAFREKLGKLPIHFSNKTIADVGNVVCDDDNMEATQNDLSTIIYQLISNHILPIAIGGGHDIAYGNFKGIEKFLSTSQGKKLGIINFDAHFDLRPVEQQANSGTPFNQILTNKQHYKFDVSYMAIGIQQQSNTKELYDIAKKNEVSFIDITDCKDAAMNQIKEQVTGFVDSVDYLYLTIDLDGFSSAYVTGVSAPSPLGFSPDFVFELLLYLLRTKKIISIDIAELNPRFDEHQLTANLAARLVDFMVNHI